MRHEENYLVILRTNEFIQEKTVHFTGDMSWRPMSTVVKYVSVSRDTMLQWIEKKGMPAHKVGRQWKLRYPK